MMLDVGLLLIRLVIGLSFMAHGAQKLFGWFGGYGIKGTGGWFESMGMKPGALVAVAGWTRAEFGADCCWPWVCLHR